MPYGKQLTQADFNDRFLKKFGEGYDLSGAIYSCARSKIEVICFEHGIFQTTPDSLFSERTKIACPSCRKIYREKNRAEQARTEFLKKAKQTYKSQYTYEDVVYFNSRSKVTITCREHGSFQQTPGKLLAGTGCPSCGLERRHKSRRLKKDEVLKRLKSVHGDALRFQINEYENIRQKITVSCQLHGKFQSSIGNLFTGRGCLKCSLAKTAHSRRLSNDDWIKKAKAVHGNRYNYKDTCYDGANNKLTIICRQHGPFEIRASNHINKKQGCRKCVQPNASWASTKRKPRVSPEKFLERFFLAHPTKKLRVDIATYENMNSQVRVKCIEHGNFAAKPSNLVRGSGCPKCAHNSNSESRRLPLNDFIKRCSSLYNDAYEYDYVEYKNLHEYILVECPQHGIWSVIAANHLHGKSGCPSCQKLKQTEKLQKYTRLSDGEFFSRCEQMHGKTYDYKKSDFQGVMQIMRIGCPKHGWFEQRAGAHMSGKGCPSCGREIANSKLTSSNEYLLAKFEEIHGTRYKYSLDKNTKYATKIIIECEQHGIFKQQVRSHLQGKGCPKCSLSKGENAVALFLERNGIEFEIEFAVPKAGGGNPMRFDFIIPSQKILIEFDGQHHFYPVKFGGMSEEKAEANFIKVKARDQEKDAWAKRNNYQLIRINYNENVSEKLMRFESLGKP